MAEKKEKKKEKRKADPNLIGINASWVELGS